MFFLLTGKQVYFSFNSALTNKQKIPLWGRFSCFSYNLANFSKGSM